MININSIRFSSNHSTVIANLKTSFYKVAITVPQKVDTGSIRNKIPFCIYKVLFTRVTVEQLDATKIQKSNLKCITNQQ